MDDCDAKREFTQEELDALDGRMVTDRDCEIENGKITGSFMLHREVDDSSRSYVVVTWSGDRRDNSVDLNYSDLSPDGEFKLRSGIEEKIASLTWRPPNEKSPSIEEAVAKDRARREEEFAKYDRDIAPKADRKTIWNRIQQKCRNVIKTVTVADNPYSGQIDKQIACVI